MSAENGDIRYVDDEEGVRGCYGLIRQLRPHLDSQDDFLERWRRQREDGYRIMALWAGGGPVALAGFRVLENLVHGRHLYVDDLVTDETIRSAGHGAQMMECLKAEARSLGCAKLLLDTPMANMRAHRFYFRSGLFASSLRFTGVIDV